MGDLAAHIIKLFITEPLYRHLGRDFIPGLGRGPRPHGAERCGWWPVDRGTAAKSTYGMPSGHAAHAVAMFVFMELAPMATRSTIGHKAIRVILGILALAVPISRVALRCHTAGQAFWGAVLGAVIGRECASFFPTDLSSDNTHSSEKASKVDLE